MFHFHAGSAMSQGLSLGRGRLGQWNLELDVLRLDFHQVDEQRDRPQDQQPIAGKPMHRVIIPNSGLLCTAIQQGLEF